MIFVFTLLCLCLCILQLLLGADEAILITVIGGVFLPPIPERLAQNADPCPVDTLVAADECDPVLIRQR